MAKNLTHRQREFLNHFLDLYQEMEEPIHNTVLADRLGLGKVTAYEMLRLLEERGLHTVVARFWRVSASEAQSRSITWSFRVS